MWLEGGSEAGIGHAWSVFVQVYGMVGVTRNETDEYVASAQRKVCDLQHNCAPF